MKRYALDELLAGIGRPALRFCIPGPRSLPRAPKKLTQRNQRDEGNQAE